VATQIIQMVRQLAPLVRFDGYHVLADLTGVPDLYGRIKPTLLGMLPWRWGDPQVHQLKWWARLVVTAWVIVVIPLLVGMLALAVITLPRLLGTAWASLGNQHAVLTTAWADGDMVQATARVLSMIAIVIPMAAVIYLLVRVGRRIAHGAWAATAGKPVKRLMVGVLGAVVLGGIAFAWWPNDDNYRPIQASERGTIGDILYALRIESTQDLGTVSVSSRPAAATRPLAAGQQGVMQALWDTRTRPPTFTQPQLAVILVPTTVSGAPIGGGPATFSSPTTTADAGWVFPFDKPLAPEPGSGDNQALAVNTTDNTVVYQAAFAMVWVTDNSYAMNINEAHAYASCESCAAVAVAYQVVFVIDSDPDNDNVAVPQNLAGALNYECVNCMTYALARQLFVTFDHPLSEAEKAALDEALQDVWARIEEFEEAVRNGDVPVDQIAPQLEAYTEEIVVIVETLQPGTFPSLTPTQTPTAQTTAQTTAPATSAVSPVFTPSETAPPPSTSTPEPSLATDPTTATESTSESTSSTTTPDQSTSSAPTAPSTSTSDGTTTDGSTTSDPTAPSDSTTGGTTSDGSTSDGTVSSP
jgi:putative peptide zinc metalloprotease protein